MGMFYFLHSTLKIPRKECDDLTGLFIPEPVTQAKDWGSPASN